MESLNHEHVIGIPVSSVSFGEELPGKPTTSAAAAAAEPADHQFFQPKQKRDSLVEWMSKIGEKAEGIREHVSLAPKISETVKGKLSMGARILQAGGVERDFRQAFSVGEGEKLLKAFQCYLSTTAGPISGMLFVSTDKIAFRSDRSLKLTSPKAGLVKVPYKVLIPLRRIKGALTREDKSKPKQKYIHIVTEDEFEFWFMGFVRCERSFKHLQQAISALQ